MTPSEIREQETALFGRDLFTAIFFDLAPGDVLNWTFQMRNPTTSKVDLRVTKVSISANASREVLVGRHSPARADLTGSTTGHGVNKNNPDAPDSVVVTSQGAMGVFDPVNAIWSSRAPANDTITKKIDSLLPPDSDLIARFESPTPATDRLFVSIQFIERPRLVA